MKDVLFKKVGKFGIYGRDLFIGLYTVYLKNDDDLFSPGKTIYISKGKFDILSPLRMFFSFEYCLRKAIKDLEKTAKKLSGSSPIDKIVDKVLKEYNGNEI